MQHAPKTPSLSKSFLPKMIPNPKMALPIVLMMSLCLSACGNTNTNPQSSANHTSGTPTTDNAKPAEPKPHHSSDTSDDGKLIALPDGKWQIDWTHIDTNITPVNPDNYPYPFAEDSLPVQNYATAYHISPKQAQHAMTIGMAAPEALNKILSQLTDGKYLGHELTDGADMTLIIHVSDDVQADKHDYVFADKFGEGLILPIEIRPKGKE